jgi:3-oxoacyl-[acyl-carrier-protein] synthase I
MKKIYINALGINNSAGIGAQNVYNSIFCEQTVFSHESVLISKRKTQLRKVSWDLKSVPENLTEFDSRNNQLLLNAIEQIRSEIDLCISQYGDKRVGIVLGTSTSGILETEKAFEVAKGEKLKDDFCYYKQEISSPSLFLSRYLKLKGISYTVSTACTSSAKAFIEAKRLLAANLCDAVIVGGVDSLCSLTLNGFDSLDSLSSKVTNPFSKNRDGINIGEGAAVFIMSHEPSIVQFLGYGESSDAYHLSSPDPEGLGAELAIQQSLKMADLKPKDVSYINLHGTGTLKNDQMESKVTHRIFGTSVPVSSTKPFIGHTLGAAGAQEAALCYLMLSLGKIGFQKMPIHLWDGDRDETLPELNFVRKGEILKGQICMSNSYAFGGNNVSLVFGGSL